MVKGDRRLYGAVNAYIHQADLPRVERRIEALGDHPFDAFIVSDLGLVPILKKYHPNTELHLSTQANCVNAEAARLYRDLGFTRIVPGRELSLREIAEIKRDVPDLELEVFVHGAMCLAYSGRCFLSAWMAERSGNRGDCAHSCRWEYRVLEEKKRPGEYYPLYEGDGFSAILSSKDINMIDHLADLIDAGVDSLKIEGRMKSTYYAAVVTRAYRKALDAALGAARGRDRPGRAANYPPASTGDAAAPTDPQPFIDELYGVSHRDFTTGFYYGRRDVEAPARGNYRRRHRFLGILEAPTGDGGYHLTVKNTITRGKPIEYIGPDVPVLQDDGFTLSRDGAEVESAHHDGRRYVIYPAQPVEEGFLIRSLADQEVW
ncbi:MAG: peptidase U32 family protein [Spirochaetota bacterium]